MGPGSLADPPTCLTSGLTTMQQEDKPPRVWAILSSQRAIRKRGNQPNKEAQPADEPTRRLRLLIWEQGFPTNGTAKESPEWRPLPISPVTKLQPSYTNFLTVDFYNENEGACRPCLRYELVAERGMRRESHAGNRITWRRNHLGDGPLFPALRRTFCLSRESSL